MTKYRRRKTRTDRTSERHNSLHLKKGIYKPLESFLNEHTHTGENSLFPRRTKYDSVLSHMRDRRPVKKVCENVVSFFPQKFDKLKLVTYRRISHIHT